MITIKYKITIKKLNNFFILIGKDFYDIWFILEGNGPNRGSVIEAFCKCKGGRDGGCKHIAAAMYSLENLLNTEGKASVTSGPCLWRRKPRSNVEPCEVKDLTISKSKVETDKGTPNYTWLQNINHDPREKHYQKAKSNEDMVAIARLMKAKVLEKPGDKPPAIFPLLCKLYLHQEEVESAKQHVEKSTTGIMETKVQMFLKNTPNPTPEEFLQQLHFTDAEIDHIEKSTVGQWQSKQWFAHKTGFVSASRCKTVFTRQTTLEKKSCKEVTALAKSIATKPARKVITHQSLPNNPTNPRDWGLKKEKEAMKSYSMVARKQHYKFNLEHKGFMISKRRPFMGASVDALRTCECLASCGSAVVEIKCPWVHRASDPKEALVTNEVGGVYVQNNLQLKTNSAYYYQVQMQMYILGVQWCDFVVWTMKGIHMITIPVDESFMSTVAVKLEKFWLTQVAPLLLGVEAGVLPVDEG